MKWRAYGLLALGLLQVAGDATGLLPLKALALGTAASPAPRVFSTVKGLEPYSTRFSIEWTDREGREHAVAVTPEAYARLRGAYNRRNAYGAAMAGGPMLVDDERLRPMFVAVARYALCDPAPVLGELGLPKEQIVGVPRVRYEPRGLRGPAAAIVLDAPCR
ncbi:MAG TPA: hypothetical protein VFQ51_02245 [Vicinamibacteria bacterium]|nr:hypothetical protein [Vicinamibacteria bacterium]